MKKVISRIGFVVGVTMMFSDAIDGANDKEFEIWTNNDNEHEIVCIN